MATRLEIFKPGRFTALNGTTYDFSETDVQAMAAAYDPALYEAPLVVGHPKVDAAAYGWAKHLVFADGVLSADADQVDAEFAAMVNEGRYKKISASFFAPDSAGNPKPGTFYLRHIGFLGGREPAVKGLKSASFGAHDGDVITFGGYEMEDRAALGFFRRLKNWLIGTAGEAKAEEIFPEYDLGLLQEDIVKEECAMPDDAPEAMPAFSTPEKGDKKMTAEEIAAKEAGFAAREEKLRAGEQAQRHEGHLSFAAGLVQEGKLLPAQKESAVALLDFAAGQDEATVIEFADGDGGCKKKGPAEVMREFLAAQPKIVEFAEVAGDDPTEAQIADFAAAPGCVVDPAGLEHHRKALAYQAKNPGVEYLSAVKAVQ